MKQKKIIFITVAILLISVININAQDKEKEDSFDQLLKEMTEGKSDEFEDQLITKEKKSSLFIMSVSGGFLIPFGQNIEDAYYNGYGGSVQLKIPDIFNFLGFKHHLGIEGGAYLTKGNSRSDLTTYMANFIIDADINQETNAILGYEIGAGIYLQQLDEKFNDTKTANDFGVKGVIKSGYKFSDSFYFTMKFGGISILNDFGTGDTQEFLNINLDISYLF